MATRTPTTPAAYAPDVISATPPQLIQTASSCRTLPSIIDLGRALAAIGIEHDRLDAKLTKLDERPMSEDKALTLLFTQQDILWHLISTMPAVTLQDAAVQIGVACHYTSSLAACDWSGEAAQKVLEEEAEALWRICLSILPLVAAAAGLDMAAMDWGQLEQLRANMFYGVEDVA